MQLIKLLKYEENGPCFLHINKGVSASEIPLKYSMKSTRVVQLSTFLHTVLIVDNDDKSIRKHGPYLSYYIVE